MCDFTKFILTVALSCILVLCLTRGTDAKKLTEATEDNCEVCVKYLTKFIASLDDSERSDPKKVEKAFKKACKNTKKDDNRLCYYIGGLEESATGMVNEMTKPISWGVPADKVCMKLYRKDAQICELKYDKQIDLAKVNLKKLKVGELKKILSDWEEQCRGCTEKSDFVKRIEELMPQYAPEAAEKRKQEL